MMQIMFNVPVPDNSDILGGWTGDQLNKLGDAITTGIYNGFVEIIGTICEAVFWISRIGIISCVIVYLASKDSKSVSLAWKLTLLYLITAVVKSKL